MSRIGNFPVVLPDKVEVTLAPGEVSIKGPLGTLSQRLSPDVRLEKVENRVEVKAVSNSRQVNGT